VTVKTVPNYRNSTPHFLFSLPASVSDCCFVLSLLAGKLAYTANPEKKELAVSVSDMLEGYDYHLRLCLKDFICSGTGAYTLIKKEQPLETAVLQYSRPLPCLCIEGWSAFMDAPRVQVCPFKDRLEELWFGITFDPLEEALIWEPACPVAAVAGLCEKREDGVCVDLPDSSQNVSRDKEKLKPVDLQLRGKQNGFFCAFHQATALNAPFVFVQVKRIDVKYAATVVHCTKRCSKYGFCYCLSQTVKEPVHLYSWVDFLFSF
uniref:Interleukin-17 receptor C/E N-terminal domain-containing protein n=1 Tax=Xiphophorus couchianus TaxID=32473 RepID=A0A3B5M6M7_9TELE